MERNSTFFGKRNSIKFGYACFLWLSQIKSNVISKNSKIKHADSFNVIIY